VMKILLDSGAYSSWSKGVSIDLAQYIAFVKANKHLLTGYVTLDQIPGHSGCGTADPSRIESAAEQSYRNHSEMKDAGLSPVPVFHQGEDISWLHRMLEDGEPYIALAPHGTRRHVFDWLDQCFGIIGGNVKVHGLGVTTSKLMRRYRFTSVDSGTWVKQAQHGQILVPMYCHGRADYSIRPRVISVTERSELRPNHISRKDRFIREQVEQFLAEVGVTLDAVRMSHVARWRVCIAFFRGLEASSETEIFHVATGDTSIRNVLLEGGARSHLISYEALRRQRRGALEEYVADA
jgi:hypothetical protein